MKKILFIATALTTLGFSIPTESQAWDRCNTPSTRIVSYTRCGRPIVATYQVYGYDRCGNPVGRWVTQQSSHQCGICNPRPSCPPSYRHSHHRVIAPAPSCPPRGGVSWFFSFGR